MVTEAEGAPGTKRFGALLERSFLLLVLHDPVGNPPDFQADPRSL